MGSGEGSHTICSCDIENAIPRTYEDASHATCNIMLPWYFCEDWDGATVDDLLNGTETWQTVQVALNTAIAKVADQRCGIIGLLIDADVNAEDATLYWNDEHSVDIGQGAIIEYGLAMHVLPTGGAPATGVTVVFGLAGDHNLDKDTVAYHVWFRLQGSGAVLCESDDNVAADNDDVATGVTLVADEYHVFRIDCTRVGDVRFYIDGHRVAAGTTFNMTAVAAANRIMQPYVSLDKAANDTVGEMYLDYVKIWQKRGFYEGP